MDYGVIDHADFESEIEKLKFGVFDPKTQLCVRGFNAKMLKCEGNRE